MNTNFKFVRFALALMIALGALGMSASAALANPGSKMVQTVIPIDSYNTYPDLCGGAVLVHSYGNLRVNDWFDENNRVVKEIDIWGGMKSDLSANGKTVSQQISGPTMVQFEYLPDEFNPIEIVLTIDGRGTLSLITLPGYGHISGGAGRSIDIQTYSGDGSLISDVMNFINGNFNFDYTELCAYFAQ